jgi:hypothetical protein
MEKQNGKIGVRNRACSVVAAVTLLGAVGRADIVEMVNGDRYSGTVISLTTTNVALQSGVQGLITLPREKLASITFRDPAPKASPNVLQPSSNSSAPDLSVLAQRLLGGSGDTNQTGQVAQQLLQNAGPEATQTYKQMVRGLLSGSLSVSELRKQTKQTIKEVEEAKEELGPEAGELLDGYLTILRQFVQEPDSK